MKDNGFKQVKLFEADPAALKALGNSGIQVMVGIPNDLLATLASNVDAAIAWVNPLCPLPCIFHCDSTRIKYYLFCMRNYLRMLLHCAILPFLFFSTIVYHPFILRETDRREMSK